MGRSLPCSTGSRKFDLALVGIARLRSRESGRAKGSGESRKSAGSTRSRMSGRSGGSRRSGRPGRLLAGALASGDTGSWTTGSNTNSRGETTGDVADFRGRVLGNTSDSGGGAMGESESEELVLQGELEFG